MSYAAGGVLSFCWLCGGVRLGPPRGIWRLSKCYARRGNLQSPVLLLAYQRLVKLTTGGQYDRLIWGQHSLVSILGDMSQD
jgi:hypothetical protein